MPYSFTEIEKDKTKTIGLVFSFLIAIYFGVAWLIVMLIKSFYAYQMTSSRAFRIVPLGLGDSLILLGVALLAAYCHWSYTVSNIIKKILGILGAETLNLNDSYHKMFQNIIDEVSVATGGTKMEGVVVPTMAMNAFALADFEGQAIIGITEGMLARLTRAQIEAVVGHEAAHIVSGDCLATTVTTSLFEMYSGLLKGFESMLDGGGRGGYSVRARGGGGAVVMVFLIYILLLVTKMLSHLVRMFLSRQREYRADAVAVRLTRDPLSLAEALYAISYRWRGGGLPAGELEAIFIVNPVFSAVDEAEGLLGDMFSTHPPMENRLAVLLDMAHMDAQRLVNEVERKSMRARVAVPSASNSANQWVIHKDGAWQGPFDMTKLMILDWLRPDMWIQRIGGGVVKHAYEDSEMNVLFNKEEHEKNPGEYVCFKCHAPLKIVIYEGVQVYKCGICDGTLINERDINRVIIREEVGFPDSVKRIAQGLIDDNESKRIHPTIKRDPKTLFKCPKCNHIKARMVRMFYTPAYRIEIDKCIYCGLVWFDKDELEVLQYMIERAVYKDK